MTRKSLKFTTGLLAAVALTTAGASMAAAEEKLGEGEVKVAVDIAKIDQPGILAMSVAAETTSLSENGSTALQRRFTGTLPNVTVTDTRTPDEIPENAAWYVLGTASDFTGTAGQAAIPAANFGWAPKLIAVDPGDSGLVFAGESVTNELEGGPGLTTAELLTSSFDSVGSNPEGSWTASADLVLSTPADVAPGGYASTITLSLFE